MFGGLDIIINFAEEKRRAYYSRSSIASACNLGRFLIEYSSKGYAQVARRNSFHHTPDESLGIS